MLENTLEGHLESVNSVAYSPDGTKIISGSGDGTFCEWDAQSGRVETTGDRSCGDGVFSVAYSPDGTKIVSGSNNRNVCIWDAKKEEKIKCSELRAHLAGVLSVAYSPDGKKIISGSFDKTICIWNVATEKREKLLEGHSGPVNSVAYSPDGTKFVSGSDDQTIRIWVSTGLDVEVPYSLVFCLPLNTMSSGNFDCPMQGMKSSAFDSCVEQCGGRSELRNITTAELRERVSKLTPNSISSYLGYVRNRNRTHVGEAQVYISHAWNDEFLSVVDILKYYFRDTPDVILWFDVLVVDKKKNHHEFEFECVLNQCQSTVLVLSSWKNSIALTNAWCLYEIYFTAINKKLFQVAMSPSDHQDFLSSLESDIEQTISNMLGEIDISKSILSLSLEEKMLMMIQKTEIDHVNSTILNFMKDWMLKTAIDHWYRCPHAIDRSIGMQSLGIYCMRERQYEFAELLFLNANDIFRKELGDGHRNTLLLTCNISLLYYKMQRYNDSIEKFTTLVVLCRPGGNHNMTCKVMKALAAVYLKVRKVNEALSVCENCLEFMEEYIGRKHRDTLELLDSLTLIYRHISRNDMALSTCTKALNVRQDVLGPEHPDTLMTKNNLEASTENVNRKDEEAIGMMFNTYYYNL